MFSPGTARRSAMGVFACALLFSFAGVAQDTAAAQQPPAQQNAEPQTAPAAAPAPEQQTQPQPEQPQPAPEQQPIQQQRTPSGGRRIPGRGYAASGVIGMVESPTGVPVIGAQITLTPGRGNAARSETTGEGIFRVGGLPAGMYKLDITAPGYAPLAQQTVQVNGGEILTIEIHLQPTGEAMKAPERPTVTMPGEAGPEMPSYQELSRRPDVNGEMVIAAAAPMALDSKVFQKQTDRWDEDLGEWDRFPDRSGDFPWGATSHWYDPFHVNRYKADKPVFGQNTFFDFNGTSTTALDVRNLFIPSGVSAQHPHSSEFFGGGGQTFVAETVRTTFDLFHGDTAFKPVDWRIRITPAFNVNQLWAQEKGVVDIDVREGTSRVDGHVGLQEAFVEKKLADLGPNYDFISARIGIQQFQSDFRGLIFNEEQPGARIFGNLDNNRIQYNAAYFWMLEKDTNSGLNKFENRHQQVMLANFFFQDFIVPGYTVEASYHYNKDDASIHFDENGFLVRPAPIGDVTPHGIQAHYIGLAGEGHIGRINVSNAFYQVLGHEDNNEVAGRRTDIDAQLATTEFSLDKDWVRFRLAGLFASGDSNPRDHVARGFDSIVDSENFAGGIFSFFNREGIRLTQTGVALVSPDSDLPDLRSDKNEGQANFVNPGIFVFNGGADFDITTKMKLITNVSYLRFHHTASLDLLLFQSNIQPEIGTDYSIGIKYRPPLSDNIVITGGVAALTPGQGLRQIYTGKTLLSFFSTVKFRF